MSTDAVSTLPAEHGSTTGARTSGRVIYTCPMHPEVQQDHSGDCPKCGMALEPKTAQLGQNGDGH